MVFEGRILGGAQKIQGNPYLNSMTVLDDSPVDSLVCGKTNFNTKTFV